MKILTITLTFLLLLVSVSAQDWPTYRGNAQRTGFYTEAVGFPTKSPLWQKSFGKAVISSPSIVDKTLYIGTRDSSVYALDTRSGQTLWKKKTGGWVDSSPLVYQNMVIVGSRDDTIYVLNIGTGEILSTLDAGLQMSSPGILSDGTILSGIGPPFKQFSAYGPVNNPKWESTAPSWSVPFRQMSYSSPAVLGNIIAIGAGDGKLYGIDATEKDTLWSLQTWGGIDLSTPAIENSMVYFAPGNYDKGVYAVDLISGAVKWIGVAQNASVKRGKTIHPMHLVKLLRLSPAHRNIAIGRLRKRGIHVPKALEATNRRSAAKVEQFFPYGGMKTSSVAVDESKVYVVQKELGYPKPRFSLIALNKADGSEVWRFTELRNCVEQGHCSSPVITKNSIFFGWGEGKLYALKKETGEKLWEDSLSADILSSPAIADAKLFVATMDGNIYCYTLSETAPGESFQKDTYCYPNPARSGVSSIQIYVEKKATMEMVAYNTAERPVFRVSRTLAAKEKFVHKWNLSKVANGVYFAIIKVKYADGGKDKKILKIAVLN